MNSSVRSSFQTPIVGERLELQPLKSSDFERLFAVASDPQIWELHPARDRYKREVFQIYFDSAIESRGAYLVLDCATGEVAGCSRFYNLDLERKHVCVGYTFLARQYWGGSYNREMKSLMLKHAFHSVNPPLDRVFFEVGEANLRSRRAMEKIGGKLVDPAAVGLKTDLKSHVVYQISASDWQ